MHMQNFDHHPQVYSSSFVSLEVTVTAWRGISTQKQVACMQNFSHGLQMYSSTNVQQESSSLSPISFTSSDCNCMSCYVILSCRALVILAVLVTLAAGGAAAAAGRDPSSRKKSFTAW